MIKYLFGHTYSRGDGMSGEIKVESSFEEFLIKKYLDETKEKEDKKPNTNAETEKFVSREEIGKILSGREN